MWQQIGRPSVSLVNPNSTTSSFTTPSVTVDATLTFKFTVTDDKGASSNDDVVITITITITDTGTTPSDNNPPVVNLGNDYEIFEGESTSITAIVFD